MKRLASFLLTACLTIGAFSQPPTSSFFVGGSVCNSNPWVLVFADDFNNTTVNQSKWFTYFPYTQDGSDQCLYCRLGDENVDHVFQDDNIILENGLCRLLSLAEPASHLGQERQHTSGMLYSKNNFHQGKFQIRCKLPNLGNRAWPAFWLNGGGTEIDIFEFCGSQPNVWDITTHRWWNNNVGHNVASVSVNLSPDFHNDFHIYTVEWDQYYLRFYLDNDPNPVYTYSRLRTLDGTNTSSCTLAPGTYLHNPAFPGSDHQTRLIINTGVQSMGSNGVCGSPATGLPALPSEMIIDWVRVYQRSNIAQYADLCAPAELVNALAPSNLLHYLCPGEIVNIKWEGVIGGSLTWETSPNLEIISTSADNVRVRQVGTGNLQEWAWIKATDSDSPCPGQPNRYAELNFWLGGPKIESITYDVAGCSELVTLNVETTPLDVHNRYFWIDDEFQYYNCSGLHFTSWYQAPTFEFCPETNDFCHDVRVEVRSNCEDYTANETITIKDNCIWGPCDILDPDIGNGLITEISVHPTPAITSFSITFSDKVDLRIIDEIYVWDQTFTRRFAVVSPVQKTVQVDCSNWPSGVYYASFKYAGENVVTKIQIK